jgi:cellulose synthase/poly-beta-1,6-N-acetylglucosamine synthase-like glycosyltransferase
LDVIVTALGLSIAVAMGLLLIGDLYLIAIHILVANSEIEKEHKDLAAKVLPPPKAFPSVCIQVPVHNEQSTVAQAVDAACSQDWPRDRLEVQILDDGSTDRTPSIATTKATAWTKTGTDVRLHRRDDRSAFKAGVLRFGLARTRAECIAIFDVDYRAEPRVLRALMKGLLSNSRIAFVQARLDYTNRDQNWLTRAQAIELGTVMAFETAGRTWSGLPLPFSDTCGVWRRQAIEGAGGWSGRSLSEDLDLSFLVLSLGWRSRFLVTTSVPGELPTSLSALVAGPVRGTPEAQ